MGVDGHPPAPLSRRRLLGAAGALAAGGAALAAAACTDDTRTAPQGPTESDEADVEVLNGLLDLELEAVAAYKSAAARMRGRALRIAKSFVEHEQDHADALGAAIGDAGGTPNGPRSDYDFPRMGSQSDALRFAVDVEQRTIAAYIDALPKLSDRELRAAAASIVTVEAEHVAVLLDALGLPPAPDPFVVGRA